MIGVGVIVGVGLAIGVAFRGVDVGWGVRVGTIRLVGTIVSTFVTGSGVGVISRPQPISKKPKINQALNRLNNQTSLAVRDKAAFYLKPHITASRVAKQQRFSIYGS